MVNEDERVEVTVYFRVGREGLGQTDAPGLWCKILKNTGTNLIEVNWIIGKGKQSPLLVENEARQVDWRTVIWRKQGWENRACLFITLLLSFGLFFLSSFYASLIILHCLSFNTHQLSAHSSLNFQGLVSMTCSIWLRWSTIQQDRPCKC